MLRFMLVGAIGLFALSPAQAQTDDVKGKTVTIVTSTGPGGGYDLIARVISRHMPRYLPGQPNMIVQNMPGGGNVLATNHMYTVAPKDGTMIAVINNAIPLHQVLDGRGVRYDVRKFNWLGSTGAKNSVTFVWHTTGITSIQEVMTREITLGGTAPASDIVIYPTVMNNVLGTKFKIVLGYQSGKEMALALERQEVDGRGSWSWSSFKREAMARLQSGEYVVLLQMATQKSPELPNVPLVLDYAKDEDQKQILELLLAGQSMAWPYFVASAVPADRVALLRGAFQATLKDKEALEEANKLQIDIEGVTGEEITALIKKLYALPPPIIQKVRELAGRT